MDEDLLLRLGGGGRVQGGEGQGSVPKPTVSKRRGRRKVEAEMLMRRVGGLEDLAKQLKKIKFARANSLVGRRKVKSRNVDRIWKIYQVWSKGILSWMEWDEFLPQVGNLSKRDLKTHLCNLRSYYIDWLEDQQAQMATSNAPIPLEVERSDQEEDGSLADDEGEGEIVDGSARKATTDLDAEILSRIERNRQAALKRRRERLASLEEQAHEEEETMEPCFSSEDHPMSEGRGES